MKGWITGFFVNVGWGIAKWAIDKMLAALIAGGSSPAMQEKVGEYVDGKIDELQKAAGESGKAARASIAGYAQKIIENLAEDDGTN
jgi:hypothetical protein